MQKLTLSVKHFLLLLVGVLVLGSTLNPAAAQVNVRIGSADVRSGNDAQLGITVEGLPADQVFSYEFTITYDPTVYTITSGSIAGTISDVGNNTLIAQQIAGNQFQVIYATDTALAAGDGALINLSITAGAGATAPSAVTFDSFRFNEGTPAVNIIDGQVFVPDFSVSFPANQVESFVGSVTVPVTADVDLSAATPDIFSMEFTATYDPAVITVTDVQPVATAPVDASVQFNTSTPGTLVVAYAQGVTPFTFGQGDVVLNIEADVVASGATMLDFTAFRFNEGNPAGAGIDGMLTVGATPPVLYSANLSGVNEVPNPVLTMASGTVDLAFSPDTKRLVVTGSFADLMGTFTGAPGAHLHVGETGTNGPVEIVLVPTLNADADGGTFEAANNTFTLTDAQIAILEAKGMYVNVHSTFSPPGEIRGQVLPAANVAPTGPANIQPGDGAALFITGPGETEFTPSWDAATDDDGDQLIYIWQVALDEAFTTLIPELFLGAGTETSLTLTFSDVDAIFDLYGIDFGDDLVIYHRAWASDGSLFTAGDAAQVTLTRGPVDVGFLQVINNIQDVDDLDIYADNVVDPFGAFFVDGDGFSEVATDLESLDATGIIPMSAGAATVRVALGGSGASNEEFIEENITFVANEGVVLILNGLLQQEVDALEAPLKLMADDDTKVEINIVHGSFGAPAVDVNVIDETPAHELVVKLADDLAYNTFNGYAAVDPLAYNIEVTTADGNTQVAVFRPELDNLFDLLSDNDGPTLTVVAQGLLNRAGTQEEFTLGLYDIDGNRYQPAKVTDVEGPEGELPDEFVLEGNYPNPFNPSTTLRFSLPEAAEVTVAVFDMLGREVMAMPMQQMAAGANRTVQIDAAALASGLYVYSVRAVGVQQTHTATGTMTLIK
ncbi:MAG: CHRD domain-containing protein [Bacteroidota bacterium]